MTIIDMALFQLLSENTATNGTANPSPSNTLLGYATLGLAIATSVTIIISVYLESKRHFFKAMTQHRGDLQKGLLAVEKN